MSGLAVLAAVLAAMLVSLVGCGAWRRLAARWQVLDIPNSRSAHAEPVPRGGGIGLLLGIVAGMVTAALLGIDWPALQLYWLLLAAALAVVGLVDDRRGLPVTVRLGCYAAASFAAAWLLPTVTGWWLLAATLYSLWLLNLFNFMDGIDTIAAVEAIFVAGSAALLGFGAGSDWQTVLLYLLIAAAALGFLYWNWSPARLFMGDAGSIPLGFLLAVLSLQGELPLACWLILLAAFIGDASITLLWRLLRGERITEAHSTHIYQRLARHWQSHGLVVAALLGYNLLWLLPLAALALAYPGWVPGALLAAYLPLLPLWLKVGKLP